MQRTIKTICMAVMTLAVTACSSGSGSKPSSTAASRGINSSNIAVMACDASFENIMQQEIDVFEFINPKMTILPMYIDESACIDSLLKGRASTAVISRELRASEIKILRNAGRAPHTTRIAVDAIALIVNKKNPLNEITVSEITDILDGKYHAWR
ncbi:MAG: substrate-binding domain-containing protein, partial [Muribaculaceae bacterium]|nr:substrate-binding domain-containing protein [Muribaculaceae bacterium]